jgi:diketogulonate reductase-like aldo/keto reductase
MSSQFSSNERFYEPNINLGNKIFTVKLYNGKEIPVLGFGTFLSKPGEVGQAIWDAIEAGYRHIDCAYAYDNQKEIGETLRKVFEKKLVRREDLFITSKLSALSMHPDEVEKELRETLTQLQLDYLDLYLFHQPVPVEKVNDNCRARRLNGYGLEDIWRKMEYVQTQGLVKSIGVSNFNAQTLNDMLNYAKILPAVLQIERHPYLPQNKLIKFCHDNHVHVQSYGPLGSRQHFEEEFRGKLRIPELVEHETIKKIAAQKKKTPAQVLLRWQIDTNCIPLPKSVHANRIKENLDIFDFQLDKEEIQKINELGKSHLRMFTQEWHGVPTFC